MFKRFTKFFPICFTALAFIAFAVPSDAANENTSGIIINGRRIKEDVLDERLLLPASKIPNYRLQMRGLVKTLSEYAKNHDPEFIIAVRDGMDLFHRGKWEAVLEDLKDQEKHKVKNKDEVFLFEMFDRNAENMKVGRFYDDYLQSIDGLFISDSQCGGKDNPSLDMPAGISEKLQEYGVATIAVEPCINPPDMTIAYTYYNNASISDVPPPNNNPDSSFSLKDARNALLFLNNQSYKSKEEVLYAFAEANYDLLIVDPFFRRNLTFNKDEIERLKVKKIGAKRLVLAYFNLSVIDDSQYFWKKHWKILQPSWIRLYDPFNPERYVVEYWHKDWHDLAGEYLRGVQALGFDGIYLDGLDYHRLFEKLTPIY